MTLPLKQLEQNAVLDKRAPASDIEPKAEPGLKAERSLDAQLDEALEETFPASDPVSLSQPQTERVRRRPH